MAYLNEEGEIEMTPEDFKEVPQVDPHPESTWAKDIMNWIIWGDNVPPIEKN